jgi:RNA polymerase sigma-70 factor (ECF subfamily)
LIPRFSFLTTGLPLGSCKTPGCPLTTSFAVKSFERNAFGHRIMMYRMQGMNDADNAIPTRRTLLSRLRRTQDDDSWQEFFELYWRLIYGVAIKFGLSDSEAQDVVQETIIAVHKKMPEFRYDPAKGSFKSWLFNLTRWRVLDQMRKRKDFIGLGFNLPGDDRETPVIERIPDESAHRLESLWDQEWSENQQAVALERVKRKVDSKQFQIFDLYVLKEWPARTVGQALKVSLTQVYLAKHRIAKLLNKELKLLEAAGLAAAPKVPSLRV